MECSKKLASYCKKGNDIQNVLNVLESERRVVISRREVNINRWLIIRGA